MKSRATEFVPGVGEAFEGGAQRFLFKGTNGRWRDVLAEDELRLYQQTVDAVLSPACSLWLARGREALS